MECTALWICVVDRLKSKDKRLEFNFYISSRSSAIYIHLQPRCRSWWSAAKWSSKCLDAAVGSTIPFCVPHSLAPFEVFWKTKNRHTISGFVKGEQSEDPRRVCHKANPDVAPFTSLWCSSMLITDTHSWLTLELFHSLRPRSITLFSSFFFVLLSSSRRWWLQSALAVNWSSSAICARTMMEMTTTSRATERWWMARSAHLTADGPPVTAARVTRRFLLYTQSARRIDHLFLFWAAVLWSWMCTV